MPNNVKNKLSVFGDEKQLEEYVRLSKIPTPNPGDSPNSLNYKDSEPKPTEFDFYGVVNLPEEYTQKPYSDFGYEMEKETWGVKWGAYGLGEITELEDYFDVIFETAWGPPYRYIQKASVRFPDLKFFLSWGGEGPTRGYMRHENGLEVMVYGDEFDSNDYPNDDDYEEDADKYHEAYQAAQRMYINSHNEWVRDPDLRNGSK